MSMKDSVRIRPMILASWMLLVAGITAQSSNVITDIIKMYKQRGLPFRENIYLGNKPILDEYDFIVVGAGPAGSVVTNRLTEIPDWSVLLLEAGVDDNIYTDYPLMSTYLLHTEYNWAYRTEKQDGICLGLEDERCPWPAGKGVGGGTIVNAMIYTRGNRKDFDNWAAMGNTGWSYDDVLPYFIKSEKMTIPELMNSPYHGKNGSVFVEHVPYTTESLQVFLNAGKEAGFDIIDYNNPETHIGFAKIQATTRQGRRVGASTAFLKPIRNRQNFHISQQAHVTKVLIDAVTRRAYGVEFIKKGRKRRVMARKEVILTAGAFNTPQILMLSGIGPEEHLNEIGIPVTQNLRVGDNLQEHVSMAGLSFLMDKPAGLNYDKVFGSAVMNNINWLRSGEGPLSSLGSEGLGYVKTKNGNNVTGLPDIELIFVPLGLNTDKGISLRKTMGITDDLYNSVYSEVGGKDTWSIWPMILYPYSRGKVRLRDANPVSHPRIYANFYADKRDLDIVVEGLKLVVELSETKAFQSLGSRLHTTPIPECARYGFGTDEYWACSARYIVTQFHHQCGTAKMGPPSDPDSVVDPELFVYGVTGLRVADTSIIPTIPGSHTMAAAYMIGEKAADMIKDTWL